MNKLVLSLLNFAFAACKREPYVEKKVDLEKKAESCTELDPTFRMISNFGGERFEFEKCLPADFDKSKIEASRQGDTVLVRFQSGSQGNTTYKVTLDIDSYPKYNFITIDEETYPITSSAN